MIRPATDTKRLKTIFYQVFKSRDPFSPAGWEKFPIRVLLYETDLYALDPGQFQALVEAAHENDEEKFFISMLEAEPEARNWEGNEFIHWECERPTVKEYQSLDLFLENAIYSENGTWGVLLSHECHGLLVCNQEFWGVFRSHYPNWEKDLESFVCYWRGLEKERGIDIEWLQSFLDHLSPKPSLQ